MSAPKLRDLEEWLVGAIVHPGAVGEGVANAPHAVKLGLRAAEDITRLVTPGPKQSALGRLGVYHLAYVARLIECIADDYPVCAWALGEDAWGELARAYVASRPSAHPSLNEYGKDARAFFRKASHPFIADLAQLEWALVDAIHADASESVNGEALRSLPPQAWATARLIVSPTVTIVRADYPVNAFFQAFKDNEEPKWPDAQKTATVVFRQSSMVYRMALTPPMAALLEALASGSALGAALETLENSLSEADLTIVAAHLSDWFASWTASGIFARLEGP